MHLAGPGLAVAIPVLTHSATRAFAPVPVLQAPYFEEEVVGAAMLDRLGDALFAGEGRRDAQALHHRSVSERLELGADGATLRLELPFAQRGDISLKRLGAELIVRVDGHKRTMLLPPRWTTWRRSAPPSRTAR